MNPFDKGGIEPGRRREARAALSATPSKPSALPWSAAPSPDSCAHIVARIRSGDEAALGGLYEMFFRWMRSYFCHKMGPQDVDDKVHDTFLIVAQAIRRGDVREPDRLAGYVMTIARRQVASFIDLAVRDRNLQVDASENGVMLPDKGIDPERNAIVSEMATLMEGVLSELSDRDREVLVRFYLKGHTQEEICEAMGLTETQFRLLKSRAKTRFGVLGKKRVSSTLRPSFRVRENRIA